MMCHKGWGYVLNLSYDESIQNAIICCRLPDELYKHTKGCINFWLMCEKEEAISTRPGG